MDDAAGRGRVVRPAGDGAMCFSSYPGSYLRSGGLRQPACNGCAVFVESADDDADGGEKGTSPLVGVFAEKPDDNDVDEAEPDLSPYWRPSSMRSGSSSPSPLASKCCSGCRCFLSLARQYWRSRPERGGAAILGDERLDGDGCKQCRRVDHAVCYAMLCYAFANGSGWM